MTAAQLDFALRAFCRRRPFRPFLIEFTSGDTMLVRHPEAVRQVEGEIFVERRPNRGFVLFTGDSVSRLLDELEQPVT
jgi:hypothetical protein